MKKEHRVRKGEYRFLLTKAGRTRFARVEVMITLGGDTLEVTNNLPDKADPRSGAMARGFDPLWEEAALEGIREALDRTGHEGTPGAGCHAALTGLVGALVDTTPDAVRCAAGLAAWRALGLDGPEPEPTFDGRLWSLHFPAVRTSPVEGVS